MNTSHIRPSDLADEFDAMADSAYRERERQINLFNNGPVEMLSGRARALRQAASLARGDVPFEHVQPEVTDHQPLVIELHSPASIRRMSATRRAEHEREVLAALAALRTQLGRLEALADEAVAQARQDAEAGR